MASQPVLRLGHSPDPDDAFMWWAIGTAHPGLGGSRFRYQVVTADIESLNRRAERGDLEITALSCAWYPRVASQYALALTGSSLGREYGPRIVARQPLEPADLRRPGALLAVPGESTTAFAAASMLLGPGSFGTAVVPFDQVISRVAEGEFTAGLVIHEGQLTYTEAGLHLVADLGAWWSSQFGLPLPLGLNALRRDLDRRYGAGAAQQVAADLRRSLALALQNRGAALEYASSFARGLPSGTVERFVDMYVNHWSIDLGEVGRAAVRSFLRESHRAGLGPDPGEVEFVG
jgi:1,4-dihydroxy-6-naphthoate synthase